uniref:Uncharacterized protein n=1 Tax=Candidatus Kentrum sp. SD TaxID=2126332 RepID=A0A451BN12_9GAMM|nr:MAG: hypothetical protein BECKSD772F_GA0070984_101520 [Candidatus Kentron sp. SD]VFK42208.1 MAG: hypothetical protein BECKSD772E_GA0070983_101520 [Candidatus Kentron sp. SD]VFK79666.1 MAG: hypothetical protein BECKSD772D_GA0070982_10592 [Candidatus Kentron sp. SD]
MDGFIFQGGSGSVWNSPWISLRERVEALWKNLRFSHTRVSHANSTTNHAKSGYYGA